MTKSNNNIVLTGTLAGIAEYLGIDPTVVRVIYVILSLVAFGSPIILYILLALIIPSARKIVQVMDMITNIMKNNNYREQTKNVKRQEKVDDDEWSDFLMSTFQRIIVNSLTFISLAVLFSKCGLCK